MKKFLAFSGLLSSMSFSLGMIAKVMHWPGANVAMYGGLLLFCTVFAPFWLYRRFNIGEQLGMDKARWMTGLFAGVMFSVGSTFKVLHYPGAGVMIVLGGLAFALVFLPLMFFRMYGTRQFG